MDTRRDKIEIKRQRDENQRDTNQSIKLNKDFQTEIETERHIDRGSDSKIEIKLDKLTWFLYSSLKLAEVAFQKLVYHRSSYIY